MRNPGFLQPQPVIHGREYPQNEDWRNVLPCQINEVAINQLLRDDPQKRRKVYLEFTGSQRRRILLELEQAGFDMATVRRPQNVTLMTPEPKRGFSCLVTGSAETILAFLYKNPKVYLASIDLPEYSWLSSNSTDGNGNTLVATALGS